MVIFFGHFRIFLKTKQTFHSNDSRRSQNIVATKTNTWHTKLLFIGIERAHPVTKRNCHPGLFVRFLYGSGRMGGRISTRMSNPTNKRVWYLKLQSTVTFSYGSNRPLIFVLYCFWGSLALSEQTALFRY